MTSTNPLNLTETQLKTQINHETIDGITIYYSYVQKEGRLVSILKNSRILIFNSGNGTLYYINQIKDVPFKKIPQPKNQIANLNISIVKNPPKTNQLSINFVMKNQKNQTSAVTWIFYLDNEKLARQWLQIIQNYKNQKVQNITEKQPTSNSPQKNVENNAFIHDTLSFGYMQGLTSNSKLKEQQKKSQILNPNLNTSNVKQSNLGASNNGQNLGNSNIKISQPKQEEKKLSQSKFITNSPSKSLQKSPQKAGGNSNLNLGYDLYGKSSKYQGSQVKGSEIHNQNSAITLREQLNSIVKNSEIRNSQIKPMGNSQIGGQSRLSGESQIKPGSNIYNSKVDWNIRFIQLPTQQTLLDFQSQALNAFESIIAQDIKSSQNIRFYDKGSIKVIAADAFTPQSKKLKRQFRNYHFIMQSCRNQFIVGVPLACLIQFEGLVALVKSVIPVGAKKCELTQQVNLSIKDLQRYTRIKNNILEKCEIYDLSEMYAEKDSSSHKRLIYLDQLLQYLPIHPDETFNCLLRPQHILDNVNQFMQGGQARQLNRQDTRILNQSVDIINKNLKSFASQLSSQTILFANYIQLKNLMHQKGLNMKYLPQLYKQVSNKNVKKYVNTIMVAKVAKDDIMENITGLKANKQVSIIQAVQKSFKLLVQGNNNVSNQFWKEIALKFRKTYSIPISNHDIIGGFFLSCLMNLIPAKYNLESIDFKKKIFKDQDIILKGFVVDLKPKIKSFSRYTTQLTEKIDLVCKSEKSKDNYSVIINELKLATNPIPRVLELSKTDKLLKQYLSFYTCPQAFDKNSTLKTLNLFQTVNIQPPTKISLTTTKNYLDWCLQVQQNQQFKKTIEDSIIIIDYWYDQNHPFHCQFYQVLSNYYAESGNIQESINFMKESLSIAIRSGGTMSKHTGHKYYDLAEKQLRVGRKKDSMENFLKAKANMQTNNDKHIKYPLTLIKLASLYLNNSDIDNCVIYSRQAVQKIQELENMKSLHVQKGSYDPYCIKAIQVLTRAYQISGKKSQFHKTALLSSQRFNKTKNELVYQQMIKICVTDVIFKNAQQKCKLFQTFIQKILHQQNSQQQDPKRCIQELMHMSQGFNVMQRFMSKFDSLQRILGQLNSKRSISQDSKQFIAISRLIAGSVGEDYIIGLIQQKQYQ